MIHIQDTTITCRAMMAALRFKNVAHETISSPFILIITQMEAPEDRYLPWIGCHWLEEWPDKHEKEDVVYYK